VDAKMVTIKRDKTDQEGAGRTIGLTYGTNLATCPVTHGRVACAAADELHARRCAAEGPPLQPR
jgi:hypothetical protein